MVYLIYLLPTEINDNVLLNIGCFDLAVVHKRFWVASKLFDVSDFNEIMDLFNTHFNISESILMNIIDYFSVDVKVNVLKYACRKGHDKVVAQLLKDPRVDPSTNNNEAISLATFYGKLDVVQLLLADPRVDPSDEDNYAIRTASFHGYYTVVKELLSDHRVDPTARDNYAIRCASENGYSTVVSLPLADPRIDPSAQDNIVKKVYNFLI